MRYGIRIVVDVKFRAFGMDLGHLHDERWEDLPDVLAPLEEKLSHAPLVSYNAHGVAVEIEIAQHPLAGVAH